MDFLIAGTASVGAGFFSNPLEVLKTRMQFQGELTKKDAYDVHYKSTFHAVYNIIRHEGWWSLQRVLISALWVQFIMNGIRLGGYQYAENAGYVLDEAGRTFIWRSVVIGSVTAALGQIACSPVFLVKTHLQTQSAEKIAVGHQYKGMSQAMNNIYKAHGVRGLYRGTVASIPRGVIGSITQLTTYKYAKERLCELEYFARHKLVTSFTGSLIAGIVLRCFYTPFDLVMTRLYNQHEQTKTNSVFVLFFNLTLIITSFFALLCSKSTIKT